MRLMEVRGSGGLHPVARACGRIDAGPGFIALRARFAPVLCRERRIDEIDGLDGFFRPCRAGDFLGLHSGQLRRGTSWGSSSLSMRRPRCPLIIHSHLAPDSSDPRAPPMAAPARPRGSPQADLDFTFENHVVPVSQSFSGQQQELQALCLECHRASATALPWTAASLATLARTTLGIAY